LIRPGFLDQICSIPTLHVLEGTPRIAACLYLSNQRSQSFMECRTLPHSSKTFGRPNKPIAGRGDDAVSDCFRFPRGILQHLIPRIDSRNRTRQRLVPLCCRTHSQIAAESRIFPAQVSLGRCFSKVVVQPFWWAKRLHSFGSGLAMISVPLLRSVTSKCWQSNHRADTRCAKSPARAV